MDKGAGGYKPSGPESHIGQDFNLMAEVIASLFEKYQKTESALIVLGKQVESLAGHLSTTNSVVTDMRQQLELSFQAIRQLKEDQEKSRPVSIDESARKSLQNVAQQLGEESQADKQ